MKFTIFQIAAAIFSSVIIYLVSDGTPLLFLRTVDPLVIIFLIASCMALSCFIAGWITNDYSWVDRMWSILPPVYSWILMLRSWPDERMILITILVTLWGARLTFNFARKGGYSGMEDYRWIEVRKKILNPFLWHVFNLLFISVYQNLLFVLFMLPVYQAYRSAGNPINRFDIIAAVLFTGFLALETTADRQQWDFQTKKKLLREKGEKGDGDFERGFLGSGLFRYSRHPNYFCEICIWWTVFLFTFSSTGWILDLSCIGAALLTLLFQGSTALTEKLSKSKYPSYEEYQARTSRIVPWFPRTVKKDT